MYATGSATLEDGSRMYAAESAACKDGSRFVYETPPQVISHSYGCTPIGVYVVRDTQTGATYLCNAGGGVERIQPTGEVCSHAPEVRK